MDKVLIYAMSVNVGGVEEYVLNLSRYNSDMHFKYEYIIDGMKTPYEEEMKALNLKYYFLPHKKNLVKNIIALEKLFKERRKDCETIYFNTSGIYYPIPYILARKYKYRIIIHSHLTGSSGWRVIVHKLNRAWIMPYCSKMFACSTPAARWMFGKKNLENVIIIPNAINLKRFEFAPLKRELLRSELGLKGSFVLGHVGRLTEVKNQSFLIELMVEAKRKDLNYMLLLVGDGEDMQMLKNKARQLGVSDKIIFYGKSNNPEDLLNCMDCFVMPSIREGFPITLVEAQANGLSCVVSDAITKEVNITGHIEFMSLHDTTFRWLDTISAIKCSRYDCKTLLRSSGYDVNELGNRVGRLLITN